MNDENQTEQGGNDAVVNVELAEGEVVTPRPTGEAELKNLVYGREVKKLARALYESECEAQGLAPKWDDVELDTRSHAFWCNFASKLLRRYKFTNIS